MLAVKTFISLAVSHFGALITFFSSFLNNGLVLCTFGIVLAILGMLAAVYFEQKQLDKGEGNV